MPRLKKPRQGELLRIRQRQVVFSFWPVEQTNRRFGLGTRVFATDPWTVIKRAAEARCDKKCLDAAKSLIQQAEDFYKASNAEVKAAKPLLLYYCFMNLAKAFILTSDERHQVDNAMHGLSEKIDQNAGGLELINAYLDAQKTAAQGKKPNGRIRNFDELLRVISGAGLANKKSRLDLPKLLPQIVPGHRLWVEGTSLGREGERFVSIERAEIRNDVSAKQIWMRLLIFNDDLTRINLSHGDLLVRSRLDRLFQEAESTEEVDGRRLIILEQSNATSYSDRPSDKVDDLIAPLRPLLWRTVLSQRPYRQFYLYAAPTAEHGHVLPQLLSIYAITFYLGSIVRYRPHHFDKILAGDYGPFIESFLNDQPKQFLYMMASEFAQREVARAAIV